MQVQEFIASGGRIFRLVDDKRHGGRVITVAYKRDIENGQVHYGATIFRPCSEHPNASFVRKPHNETAVIRATEHPVTVPDIEGDDFNAFKRHMRRQLYRHGVACRVKDEG